MMSKFKQTNNIYVPTNMIQILALYNTDILMFLKLYKTFIDPRTSSASRSNHLPTETVIKYAS